MPLRHRKIHDSDCDSPPPLPPDESQDDTPASKIGRCCSEGSVVIIISDDSDSDHLDASQVAVAAQDVRPVMNPLHFAAKFGRFPSPDDWPLVASFPESRVNGDKDAFQEAGDDVDDDDIDDDHHDADDSDGNLWNAVPPVQRFLDLEAQCSDDTSSGSSYSSDGELTPGFVDDLLAEQENISGEDIAYWQRHFPRTLKCS